MGGMFSSPEPAAPPEKINTAGPTGSTQFGRYDADGNFIPDANIITQLTTESPFQQQFRTGTEGLQLGLLGQVDSSLPAMRNADTMRGILPSAQASNKGIPSLYGVGDVKAELGGLANLSDLTSGISTDFSGDTQRTQDAVFNQVKSRLDPVFKEQKTALAQQLADQGIPIGSEAYTREMNRIEESQGRQLQDAAYSSIQAGSTEADRLARLGLDVTGTKAGLRQQGLVEGATLAGLSNQQREQLFNENRALLQDALTKQLSLSNLEQQQRAQKFGEIGTLAGLTVPYSPTPITAVGGKGAEAGGGGYQLLGALAGSAVGKYG